MGKKSQKYIKNTLRIMHLEPLQQINLNIYKLKKKINPLKISGIGENFKKVFPLKTKLSDINFS